MSGLTASDLKWMHAEVDNLMPDTCNILSVTRTGDSQGGFTQSWGTASANVSCRIDSVTAAERVAVGAIQPFHSYWLTVPQGTTITTENKVEIDSTKYAITSVDTPKSWGACIRAWIELETV